MVDSAGKGTDNIALFVTQIVSAASGVVIAASCLFLRKWHPPVAYTAAFNISFWIGVQAMITHISSAISARLPEASENMQRNKPLVRFLVWAQFAMPLWFVFLNATIATDLMLSQLCRLSATKLQAIHKWYLPVATTVAFALAMPLLIYHSAYQPEANVFSVQFPSALSVTLYYILAFDVWLAIGILYCFVVVSLVVAVLLIKLRRKRAAWRLQNLALLENDWLPLTPVGPDPISNRPLEARHATEQTIVPVCGIRPSQESIAEIEPTDARQTGKRARSSYSDAGHGDDSRADSNAVHTFAQQPQTSMVRTRPTGHSTVVMSGVKFSSIASVGASTHTRAASELRDVADPGPDTAPLAQASQTNDATSSNPHADNPDSSLAPDGHVLSAQGVSGERGLRDSEATVVLSRARNHIARYTRRIISMCIASDDRLPEHNANQPAATRPGTCVWPRGLTLSLSNLQSLVYFQGRSRSQPPMLPGSSPFRIPTLALVRLLLYPLIPILSFTLMCVVRWVWFRSAMPSQWEILNVVSGFLRALEGFLCLIVFLLNPALNRSFREIRKRNTPVFT